jgi:hypothetical protein
MADYSSYKISGIDTFESWKTKYNLIPDLLETISDDVGSSISGTSAQVLDATDALKISGNTIELVKGDGSSETVEIPSLRNDADDVATGVITFSNVTDSTSTTTGAVIVSGGVGIAKNLNVGGTITETSDSRLKENVSDIKGALESVVNLRGVSFNKVGSDEVELGFIAQEVEPYAPELVKTDEEGMKSVSYARTVALLVEAIKELKSEIEVLKSK